MQSARSNGVRFLVVVLFSLSIGVAVCAQEQQITEMEELKSLIGEKEEKDEFSSTPRPGANGYSVSSLRRPIVRYTDQAVKRKFSGTAEFTITVDTDGQAKDIRVKRGCLSVDAADA
jgi:outer membrane biosynthesis protein TonB